MYYFFYFWAFFFPSFNLGIFFSQIQHFRCTPTKLFGYLISDTPFKKIGIDIYGPCDFAKFSRMNKTGYFYIITIVDYFSRITMFFPTERIRGKEIVKTLQTKWIEKYEKPQEIVTDQGRQFMSDAYIEFCENNNIKRITTTPYNPTANSIVERVHGTLGYILRIYKDEIEINHILEYAENNLNYGHHSVLKCSPIELINKSHPLNINNVKISIDKKSNLVQQTNAKIKSLSDRNKTRCKNYIPKTGSMVMLKSGVRNSKLDPIWEGPFKVIAARLENNVLDLLKDSENVEAVNIKRIRVLK